MNKSILIIDTTETCENCKCKYPSYKDDELYDCAITGKGVPINGMVYGEKPKWCPLKEMPKRKDMEPGKTIIRAAQHEGWNACIDEILKELD